MSLADVEEIKQRILEWIRKGNHTLKGLGDAGPNGKGINIMTFAHIFSEGREANLFGWPFLQGCAKEDVEKAVRELVEEKILEYPPESVSGYPYGEAFRIRADYEDKLKETPGQENDWFWILIHKDIRKVAEIRFRNETYADAVEAAFKEVNDRVKKIFKDCISKELDGAKLMQEAFSPNKPVIKFRDSTLSEKSLEDMQRGYMNIFAGAMLALRNPKAHHNLTMDKETAIHQLFLASTLMHVIDNASYCSDNEK